MNILSRYILLTSLGFSLNFACYASPVDEEASIPKSSSSYKHLQTDALLRGLEKVFEEKDPKELKRRVDDLCALEDEHMNKLKGALSDKTQTSLIENQIKEILLKARNSPKQASPQQTYLTLGECITEERAIEKKQIEWKDKKQQLLQLRATLAAKSLQALPQGLSTSLTFNEDPQSRTQPIGDDSKIEKSTPGASATDKIDIILTFLEKNFLTGKISGELNLEGYTLDEQAFARVMSLLGKAPQINSLNLKQTNLGDGEALTLSAFLVNPTNNLTSLDLSHNPLGDRGTYCILEALEDNKNLTSLNLQNTNAGAENLTKIEQILSSRKQEKKDEIRKAVVEKQPFVVISKKINLDVSALKSYLHEIYTETPFDEEGACFLKEQWDIEDFCITSQEASTSKETLTS